MDRLLVKGGNVLKGVIHISGAKNAALPAMAATILSGGGSFRLSNIPDLVDVSTFSVLLRNLGADVAIEGRGRQRVFVIDTAELSSFEAPYDLVRTMRASVLVLGPLVARCGRARVSMPGGCAIGLRSITWHTDALELMGARVSLDHGNVAVDAPDGLCGADIYFDAPTVTGTENVMMAATLARGKTVIYNAAREPEVVDLGMMLKLMGARISGLGSETVTIEGVNTLEPVEWSVIPDRIEAGTYIMAVGAAGGELDILDAEPSHLEAVINKLRECGLSLDVDGSTRVIHASHTPGRSLASVDMITRPYPGFPTDLQAQLMALMSIASGLSVIKETIFENRFMHIAELRRLGARIREEGRSAIVEGVRELNGAQVMATDLRASASLVLAALAARGETVIHRVYHLDRGYERLEEKLAAVGADIKRIGRDEMAVG